jgi:hypothetical protein
MHWDTFILSLFTEHDSLWSVLGTVVALFFSSRYVRNNIPPDGRLRRTIHWAHGLLDEIDPPSVDAALRKLTKLDRKAATRKATLGSLLCCLLLLQGCAAAIPKVSTPCDGLYCLEWSGNEVGLPASALICAKTEFELQSMVRKLSEQHPRSTFRKVGAR